MVNLTSLVKIYRFLNEEPSLSQMKKWSMRFKSKKLGKKCAYLKKLIYQIRLLLVLVSGDSIEEMLKGSQKILYF